MASKPKAAKSRIKPPKSRPESTSALSQHVTADVSTLSAFSPDEDLFALVTLAVDKHRLRVYKTSTGQAVSEHTVDSARVTCLRWTTLDPAALAEDSASPPKKRRKSSATAPSNSDSAQTTHLVTLGLSNGSIEFFSPSHGRLLRTLSNPSSTTPILSFDLTYQQGAPILWTSSQDCSVRVWQFTTSSIIATYKAGGRVPYSVISHHSSDATHSRLLAADHSIRLLSYSTSSIVDSSPKEVCSFTGHASSVTVLQWDRSQSPPNRFVSIAEGDRIAHCWQIPEDGTSEGQMIASIPMESDIRQIVFSSSTLLAISSSGKLSIFHIPAVLPPPAKKSKHVIPTLSPQSIVSVNPPLGKKGALSDASGSAIVSACFLSQQGGRVKIARLVGGIKPVFDTLRYVDDDDEFISVVKVNSRDLNQPSSADGDSLIAHKRYVERPDLPVASGVELGRHTEMEALPEQDGELDVDVAELSLGQRLKGLAGGDGVPTSSDDDDESPTTTSKASKRKAQSDQLPVTANSLTLTLIQALHSADSRLLETCLAHSDVTLIQNTVRRLPPQFAVPLLNACVERLGRGHRAGTGKGGGGGASAQRGMTLVGWVKAVLIMHSGHLMTMPDLVARLSGLHATLTTRLMMQDRLLSLSGRLDLVLSQIELRSSTAPAPIVRPKSKKKRKGKKKAEETTTRYVEGDSSDDDLGDQVEIEAEGHDDAGSVEDVELGGGNDTGDDESESSEDDEEGEEEDEDATDGEEDEESESDSRPHLNGFVDDEAEEEWEDDESGSD